MDYFLLLCCVMSTFPVLIAMAWFLVGKRRYYEKVIIWQENIMGFKLGYIHSDYKKAKKYLAGRD